MKDNIIKSAYLDPLARRSANKKNPLLYPLFQRMLLPCLLIAILIALSMDTRKAYGKIVTGLISSSLKDYGFQSHVTNPALNWFSLTGDKLIIDSGSSLFAELELPKLSISPTSMMLGQLNSKLNANLYQGDLKVHLNKSLFGANNLNLNTKSVDLSKYPLLKAFGVTNGTLNLNIKDLKQKNNTYQSGELKLEILDLKRSRDSVVEVFRLRDNQSFIDVANISLNNFIEDQNQIDLAINANFLPDKIDLPKLTASLGLGTLSGSGSVIRSNLNLVLPLVLTDKGLELLAPIIKAFYGQTVTNEFTIYITGNINSPRVKLLS